MKPFIVKIIVAIAILLGSCDGKLQKKAENVCAKKEAMADLDIERFSGHWYQLGGNFNCPGCCITYFLGQMSDGLSVKTTSSVNRGPPSVTGFNATQDATNKGRFVAPPDVEYKILWTNYDTAAITFTEVGDHSLCLFTRRSPTLLDMAKYKKYADECNVEINWYHPSESCTGVKSGVVS